MARDETEAALRQADARLRELRVPAEVSERLRERLFDRPARRRTSRLVVAATGLAFAFAIAAVLVIAPWRTQQRLDTLAVREGCAHARATADGVQSGDEPCVLEAEAQRVRVTLIRAATVKREAARLRVVTGRVDFDVQPRKKNEAPVEVRVSHGVIRVLGTRFEVTQMSDSGQVTLREGHVAFVSDDGRERRIEPGESLGWPLPEEAPTPQVAPESPVTQPHPKRRSNAPVRQLDLEALLVEVEHQRARGLYDEAAEELRAALPRAASERIAARLSFELGSILTFQLHDSSACAHWRKHKRRFGDADGSVTRAERTLGCEAGRSR